MIEKSTFNIQRARMACQRIRELARQAEDALCDADSATCAERLNEIENNIATLRDSAPWLLW
jgi:hypothetical protein